MFIRHPSLLILCFFIVVVGCQSQPQRVSVIADARANALFDQIFDQWVARSPTFQTWLGIKTDYGEWDDLSEEHAVQSLALHTQQLKRLREIDPADLSDDVALSYRLMEEQLQEKIDWYRWRHHNYPVNQMFGWHSRVPSMLINQHTIANVADVQAYISRLKAVPELFDQLIVGLELRADKGILPPEFVYPLVISDSRNIITGAPFDGGEDSALYADVKSKINALDIEEGIKKTLISDAEQALQEKVAPAYRQLIVSLSALSEQADKRAGVWKFPDGDAFYRAALQKATTTDLTAEQVHQLGLAEVERIHSQMLEIIKRVEFDGSLSDFFTHLRESERYYYANTDEGRQRYLARTAEVIAEFSKKLDEVFITKPQAELKVKRVESYREQSAGKAFYDSPPPDGSRPGIYYANLYNMKEMPKYELEALVYHEGLPGHHLQLSIASEMQDVPKFRKFGGYTAYTEGWGLYAEYLPKEMGLYQDPYSDFGRLAMELWRAVRLVVDTGIHHKQWSSERAIEYFIDNTPLVESGARREVERYIVMPAQATAYKIGMIKILELRERARAVLGAAFDIREYHEKVLRLGPVPLDVLEEEVVDWAQRKRAQAL